MDHALQPCPWGPWSETLLIFWMSLCRRRPGSFSGVHSSQSRALQLLDHILQSVNCSFFISFLKCPKCSPQRRIDEVLPVSCVHYPLACCLWRSGKGRLNPLPRGLLWRRKFISRCAFLRIESRKTRCRQAAGNNMSEIFWNWIAYCFQSVSLPQKFEVKRNQNFNLLSAIGFPNYSCCSPVALMCVCGGSLSCSGTCWYRKVWFGPGLPTN